MFLLYRLSINKNYLESSMSIYQECTVLPLKFINHIANKLKFKRENKVFINSYTDFTFFSVTKKKSILQVIEQI